MTSILKERPGFSWWQGEGNRWYDRHEQLEAVFTRAYSYALPEDPEEYWKIVGEVWKLTEFPCYQIEAWSTIFSESPGPNRYTTEWLKNPQTVYRGIDKAHLEIDCDWSWTTDKNQAEWFANRNSRCLGLKEPFVKEFDCSKDTYRVWCVFENDPENEVLLWSSNPER
jgi:hypothetical protein